MKYRLIADASGGDIPSFFNADVILFEIAAHHSPHCCFLWASVFSCHNKTSKLTNLILHQFGGLHKLWGYSLSYTGFATSPFSVILYRIYRVLSLKSIPYIEIWVSRIIIFPVKHIDFDLFLC